MRGNTTSKRMDVISIIYLCLSYLKLGKKRFASHAVLYVSKQKNILLVLYMYMSFEKLDRSTFPAKLIKKKIILVES